MILQDDSRCWDAEHHSYSRDTTFDSCQMLYNLKHLERGIDPLGWQGVVGWSVDQVAMDMLEGKDPRDPQEIVFKYGQKQLDLAASAGLPLKMDLPKMQRIAQDMTQLFERELLPVWLKRGVYATQMLVHWKVNGVMWHCHIDVVFQDGSVWDLKTSQKSRLGIGRAKDDYQLTTYSDAIWRAYDHLPPEVGIAQLTGSKPPRDVLDERPGLKAPWLDQDRGIRTRAQLEAWERNTARRQAAMDFAAATGTYQTNGIGSIYQCRECPVKKSCPAWTE